MVDAINNLFLITSRLFSHPYLAHIYFHFRRNNARERLPAVELRPNSQSTLRKHLINNPERHLAA